MVATACLLCGSTDTAERLAVQIPLLGTRPLLQCGRCAFGFVHPRPAPAELGRFYSNEYFQDEHGGRGFTDYFQKSHARRGEGWLMGRRLRRWRPRGRVLDVGCGAGDFLRGVQETSGWEAYGTDLSQEAVAVAGREPGLKLFRGELHQARYPDRHFDAVFVRNVLEHVLDPARLLEELRRVLRLGGRLWLLVPNARTEYARFRADARAGRAGENPQAHLNFFTPASFRVVLERRGFEVERVYTLGLKRGLFELGYLPAGLRTKRRPGKKPSASDPKPVHPWKRTRAYAGFRHATKSFLKLPVWLPLGQELHAVARRPEE